MKIRHDGTPPFLGKRDEPRGKVGRPRGRTASGEKKRVDAIKQGRDPIDQCVRDPAPVPHLVGLAHDELGRASRPRLDEGVAVAHAAGHLDRLDGKAVAPREVKERVGVLAPERA